MDAAACQVAAHDLAAFLDALFNVMMLASVGCGVFGYFVSSLLDGLWWRWRHRSEDVEG